MRAEQLHSDHSREAGDFIGNDTERAYGDVLKEFGYIQGGVNDHGIDFVSLDKRTIPDFQIKSSWFEAERFMAESLRIRRFKPIAIGEPGNIFEMAASFKDFGGWVAKDEPLREDYLQKIKKLREFIG